MAFRALDSPLSSSSSLLIKQHHSLWEEMQPLYFQSISSKMLCMVMVQETLHRVMLLEVSLLNSNSQTDKLASKTTTLSTVEVPARSFTESIYIYTYISKFND